MTKATCPLERPRARSIGGADPLRTEAWTPLAALEAPELEWVRSLVIEE